MEVLQVMFYVTGSIAFLLISVTLIFGVQIHRGS